MKGFLVLVFMLATQLTTLAQTVTLNGRIVDDRTGEALPYASLYIPARRTGTLSNADGAFQFKIATIAPTDTVVISLLGYKPYRLPLTAREAQKPTLLIRLQPATTTLQEVVVRPVDPRELVRQAIRRVGRNYPDKPELLQGFYREWVREKPYLVRAEGLLELYKSSYKSLSQDEARLVKGRRKLLFPHLADGQDTCYVPSMTNGPHLGILLDVVKGANEAGFFVLSLMDNFTYELIDRSSFNNRDVYVIQFWPGPGCTTCFYQGKLFIDQSSLALIQAEYRLSGRGLQMLNTNLGLSHLPIRIANRSYLVSYQLETDRWVMHHAQSRSQYVYYPINTRINTQMDLVITKTTAGDVKRFPRRERLDVNQGFAEEIRDFDGSFWGDENTMVEEK